MGMWKPHSSVPPATRHGKLSVSEKAFLSKHCHTMTNVELATKLGRTYNSIASYFRKCPRTKIVKRRNVAPFLKMSAETLAYMAGIIDGEGTVTVSGRGQAQISVANTSNKLAGWMESKGFGLRKTRNIKGRPYWNMVLGGYSIIEPLKKLLPYLVIKRQQAELVIEYIDLRLSQGHRFTLSARMEEIIREIRALNERRTPAEFKNIKLEPEYMTSPPAAALSSPTDSSSTIAI
jgi:hypothetical protein